MRAAANLRAVALTFAFGLQALMPTVSAMSLERVEFDSAAERLVSGRLIPGDRIRGHLAKPEGAGPFPAVVGLHGCGGMHDTTRQKLAADLVARGYVVLLVDSYATRGIDHACTSAAFATFLRRRPDAYGGLVFLARQSFVDARRVAVVGFSAGGRVSLSMAEPNSLALFEPPSALQFRAAAAFYPPCKQAMTRPAIPTIIFTGALDEWTPAADCTDKVAHWGNNGPPVELVVHPGAHHGFYYPHLQPGLTMFGYRLEHNGEAAADSSRRLMQFLARHLN